MARGEPLSLKARAIGLLAQREHSLAELRRKLLRLGRDRLRGARQVEGDQAGLAPVDAGAVDPEVDAADLHAEVEALLQWLQDKGYLSEARFVESRIHARRQRYGNLRIQQELAQHGVQLAPAQRELLQDSELERARQIWLRKFGGEVPQDAATRGKQMRFLAGRGFTADVIRRVLRAEDD